MKFEQFLTKRRNRIKKRIGYKNRLVSENYCNETSYTNERLMIHRHNHKNGLKSRGKYFITSKATYIIIHCTKLYYTQDKNGLLQAYTSLWARLYVPVSSAVNKTTWYLNISY